VAETHAPERARAFRRMLAARAAREAAKARSFVASDRHRLEVNYYDYRRLMKRLTSRFGPVRKMKLEPQTPVIPEAEPRRGEAIRDPV
jgi:hypothetical protein